MTKKELEQKPTYYERFMGISFETRLLILFGLGIAVLAAAFWQYADHFGYYVNEKGKEADWGTFGDFIGGTTNPILSFLALIGVLWSLSQNQRQNKADNLFKVIEFIHEEASKLMNTVTIVRKGELGHFMEEQIPLIELAYRFSYDKKYETDWKAILVKVHPSITNLITLLIQMRVYLIKLEQQCKDKTESEFFKVHYYRIVDLLYKTGQGVPDILKDFFSERSLSYLSKEATDLIEKQRKGQ